MTSDLKFLALGGLGEIGMNVYLYGMNDRWIMVDLGISFADDRVPGADKILPDLSFIEENRDQLDGIIITHAHEDHIGAVPHLWTRLGCPIYCNTFTASVLRHKIDEMEEMQPAPIHEIKSADPFEVGPFQCRMIHMTHSIPDAGSLVIETPHGHVVHSGDWKLDPAPQIGEPSDLPSLEKIGAEGVLALIGDSTNVMTPGVAGSEAEVRDSLRILIAEQPNRVVLTTFASNIARLETAIVAATAAGRKVCVVGRSMHRMMQCAQECGLIKNLPILLDERDVADMPRDRVLLLVTGCQGEPRAALMRIAAGQHPRLKLEEGDTAIFSSKIIPGNERTLFNLHNNLVNQGIEVITEHDHFIHVSGHPCRDEIEQMYRLLKPQIAIPMHGEARHLHAHAQLANDLGVKQTKVLRTGEVLRLAPGEIDIIDDVQTGRRALEDSEMLDTRDDLYRSRKRLHSHGTILVSIVLDNLGSVLASPKISTIGVYDSATIDRLTPGVSQAVSDAIDGLDDDQVNDNERIEQVVRTAIRQSLALPRYRRPIVEIQTTRLEAEVIGGATDYRIEATR